MSVRDALGRDLRTTVIAVIAAVVVAGPSAAAAAYVANADKVDNKHAVGFGASVAARKGKLVATNPATGLLPNNILAKALNSDKLDGLDSTAFLSADGKALDSDQLDGLDATAFLSATGKATDADQLDGLDSSAFLSATGKASDADKLDGRDSAGLLSRQATSGSGDPDTVPLVPLGNAVRSYVQVTLTVPTAGRIQVDAVTTVLARKQVDEDLFAELSINSTPNAHSPVAAGMGYWDVSWEAAPGIYRDTLPVTRTFTVEEPGTYTYYLVGRGTAPSGASGEGAGPWHYATQMNAQFFPAE